MSLTILQGDCREVLRTLPDQSVQCVITSPPYWNLRSYLDEASELKAHEIGSEPTPQAYVAVLVEVFSEVWRVLRDDGVLWLNLDDSYANDRKWGGATGGKHAKGLHGTTGIGRNRTNTGLPSKSLIGLPWRVALALQDAGWTLRCDVIWHKPSCMPESVTDRPTRDHEYLFLLTKGERYFYDAGAIREPASNWGTRNRTGNKSHTGGTGLSPHTGLADQNWAERGRNKRSVWQIANQPYSGAHFATFPEKLVETCLLAGTSPIACEHCGAPFARVIMPTGHVNQREPAHQPGRKESTKTDSTGWAPVTAPSDQIVATCGCENNTGAGRCVVLDPFAGSGTTGRVALRHNRQAILVELNPDYISQAERRTDGVQPTLVGLEAAL